VKRLSFDMDLPVVTLCQLCAYCLMVGDQQLFKDMDWRRRRKSPTPPAV
jgi:hypothetical protein